MRQLLTKKEKQAVAKKYKAHYKGKFEVMDKRIKPDGSLDYYVIYHPDTRRMMSLSMILMVQPGRISPEVEEPSWLSNDTGMVN